MLFVLVLKATVNMAITTVKVAVATALDNLSQFLLALLRLLRYQFRFSTSKFQKTGLSTMSEELTESVEDVASWRYRGINQHPSYVGVMTREEAELRVKKDRDCRYLTSYDKTWNSYVLTAKEMKGNSLTKVTNFKIVISEKNSYHVEGKEEKKFDFYSDLINHHMKNELKNELLCVQVRTNSFFEC